MIYKNRSVLLASKHYKEQAIAPIFRDKLACNLIVADIDTDQFGTFTGDVPRKASAYETCVLKAKYAAFEKKHTLSIASEGSFGPHPSNPFMAHGHEIMVFIDLDNDWIIAEHLLTYKTNYKMMTITKNTNLESFLKEMKFPSHALTLQSSDRLILLDKGINTKQKLYYALREGFKKYNELLLATDMRAMMNPTRMQTLSELAVKLTTRIANFCPKCTTPGFGFNKVCGNLPCEFCGSITKMYRFEEWGCIKCDYKEQRERQDQIIRANPNYCDFCNP